MRKVILRGWSALLLPAALIAASTVPARADVADAVNWARQQGCPHPARPALRDNPKLALAAQRLAAGGSLHSALAAVGYLAAKSSAVYLSGATADGPIRRLLAVDYCAGLTDPAVSEMGVQRRGSNAWVVVAAPVHLPSAREAPAIARQILDAVNRARAIGYRCGAKVFAAVPLLTPSPALTRAAAAHSREMAASLDFDHRGPDGSSPAARVAREGYGGYAVVGENIAAGAMTAAEVAQGWLDSPPHCENIMDRRFTEVGIAYAVNPASPQLIYWTQDFAAPLRRTANISR